MVDWDVMNRAKQIISVLPEQYFFGPFGGANLVVITADAMHGGRGGGGGGGQGWGGGGRGHRENCFMALNNCKNLNNMSSKCITDLNH